MKRIFEQRVIDRPILEKPIKHHKWPYDYIGYITNGDLKQIISDKHILPQEVLLNGKMPMDAENYHVQSRDMHKLSDFNMFFKSYNGL